MRHLGGQGNATIEEDVVWLGAAGRSEEKDASMDRVALVAVLWFVGWIAGSWEFSKLLFDDPGTGAICGFILALLTVFAWPWVLPPPLEHWMHDPHA